MALWNSKLAQRLSHIVLPCLLGSAALRAQESATLRGVVTDKSSGKAVVDAQIIMLEDTRSASSDSSGRYEISGLRPGASKLVVRAAGFPPLRVDVELIAGKTTDRAIQLDSTDAGRLASAQSLPAVSVSAPATPFNYRLADFERRRQTGRGQYLTEDEITKSGAYNIADAVKTMRGVNYECGGGAGCYVRMARAPMRCLPEFIVDGQVMNDFGPVTPIRDLVALEVYTGPTEVPGEYAGRYAGCGVIVVWTRSGPTRKRK